MSNNDKNEETFGIADMSLGYAYSSILSSSPQKMAQTGRFHPEIIPRVDREIAVVG